MYYWTSFVVALSVAIIAQLLGAPFWACFLVLALGQPIYYSYFKED